MTAEQTPEYTGVTPERAGDEQYAYVFSGWEPVQGPNDSDMIYKAVFEKTERSYTVTWLDENGDVLSTDTVVYGEFPAAPEMAAEKTVTETVEVPAAAQPAEVSAPIPEVAAAAPVEAKATEAPAAEEAVPEAKEAVCGLGVMLILRR